MERASIPPDVWYEIALLCSPKVLAQLLLLSKLNLTTLRALLYSDICVGDGAARLVNTLASGKDLPPLIISLEFMGSDSSPEIDADKWAEVLSKMNSLRRLVIGCHVPLKWATLTRIQFRLHSFTSLSSLIGPWATFVATQPDLREISCLGDFFTRPPDRLQLPVLRRLKAPAEDVAKFARIHLLEHIWIWSGPSPGRRSLSLHDLAQFSKSPARLQTVRLWSRHLLQLIENVPAILATVHAVVLDEDPTWFSFAQNSTAGTLLPAVAALDGRTPLVENLRLVCTLDRVQRYPPLCLEQGMIFSSALLRVRASPLLRNFHFCAVDRCATWRNWGSSDEMRSYPECGEDCPSYFS
ncbi:hypothetical protein FB451DRAFT_1180772 [Mycena latifolia]|nr:hypothetical protein FB451DRAFT_1180772 [Mycena latifolia]